MELKDFIEEKLNYYAEGIIKGNQKMDEHAHGELTFYMALRRVVNKNATPEDFGLMDAVNDTLQEFGHIAGDKTFFQ
ncbi:MAG: hypothetical protein WCT77_08650 [Bacteroidota bacterium]